MFEHQIITRTTLALAVLIFVGEAGTAADISARGAAEVADMGSDTHGTRLSP
jgi:hypothetical protein